MNTSKKEVGKRIAEARKAKNIKQKDFKDLIEAPTIQMISGWENGHAYPSPIYLIKIAKKLDISLDYLLFGEEKEKTTIKTYKDLMSSIFEIIKTSVFTFSNSDCGTNEIKHVSLGTYNKTICKFMTEFDVLWKAANSLRPELFTLALKDLLDKYDYPIEKKKSV